MHPMIRVAQTATTLASLLAPLAISAQGQATPIQSGQTLTGMLEASDPMLPDSSHYDVYLYRGEPAQRIIVTLRSLAFDTFLMGGSGEGDAFTVSDEDDDGGGGTDSRITATTGPDGTYVIRASSFEGGQTGEYTISVEPGRAPAEPVAPIEIALGQVVMGRLEATDPELEDGSFYDMYIYRGTSNEQIVITMRSTEFDAYLSGGRFDGSTFVDSDSDDDSGGDTNARMTVTVGPDGTYAIRANSLGAGESGAYTLTVERP